MKKIILGLLILPRIIYCADDDASVHTSIDEDCVKDHTAADYALMNSIDVSNHNGVLQALRDNANQNYLWSGADCNSERYADLTAIMFALKKLRENNRKNYIWNLASAITRDVGRCAMTYVVSQYAAQYPIITYAAPLRQSYTAEFLLGPQNYARPVIASYRPEKEIALRLLTHAKTDLKVERATKWQGNPVNVMTYLNGMLASYNPLTCQDGKDLSFALSKYQCRKAGIDNNCELPLFITDPFAAGVGFPSAQNGGRNRRGMQRFYFMNDDENDIYLP